MGLSCHRNPRKLLPLLHFSRSEEVSPLLHFFTSREVKKWVRFFTSKEARSVVFYAFLTSFEVKKCPHFFISREVKKRRSGSTSPLPEKWRSDTPQKRSDPFLKAEEAGYTNERHVPRRGGAGHDASGFGSGIPSRGLKSGAPATPAAARNGP